ncbi:hypothetical protein EMMF5_003715 [Cystobasidiomycetes sp. EMM_F5]
MSGPEYLDYKSSYRAFALAFSSSSGGASTSAAGRYSSLHPYPADLKLAVGSYSDSSSESNITIIGLSPQFTQEYDTYGNASQPYSEDGTASGSDFVALAKQKTAYPVTKVDFSPASLASKLQASAASGSESREMLASTSDCLRLWDLAGPQEGLQSPKSNFVGRQTPRSSYSLSERSTLTNSKGDVTAPLTSFCWSTISPSSIVTSSIDTTCTIWDISTNQAVTQLISHDREVFDVAWSPNSKDVFASVGADGSVRSFDLRQLDHSTILYESASTNGSRARGTPLLRLAFNPNDANTMAVLHADSPIITVLDVRSPGLAIAELRSHSAAVNGIAWQGSSASSNSSNGYHDYPDTGSAMLASVGDDSQVLLWNTIQPNSENRQKQTLPRTFSLPNSAATMPFAVDSVAWGGGRDYLAIAMGDTVRCMRL